MDNPAALREEHRAAPDGRRAVLVTGAAARIGEAIARLLHERGCNVIIHCHRSQERAQTICSHLNAERPDSARCLRANLGKLDEVRRLAEASIAAWGRLDGLVNNASAFYPTPIDSLSETQWEELFASNAKAPLFLIQRTRQALAHRRGCIINISDIHARRGLPRHAAYLMAKGAQEAMTRTLAMELAPSIRVNGIAPGAILWPESEAAPTAEQQRRIIAQTSLKRTGAPLDIAHAAWFLLERGTYLTGEIIRVAGGR